jgi:hypothetical protein
VLCIEASADTPALREANRAFGGTTVRRLLVEVASGSGTVSMMTQPPALGVGGMLVS